MQVACFTALVLAALRAHALEVTPLDALVVGAAGAAGLCARPAPLALRLFARAAAVTLALAAVLEPAVAPSFSGTDGLGRLLGCSSVVLLGAALLGEDRGRLAEAIRPFLPAAGALLVAGALSEAWPLAGLLVLAAAVGTRARGERLALALTLRRAARP